MNNTLNTLFYQLNVIRRLINEDKKKGVFKYNYLIHTKNCLFLDIEALRNYITIVDVKNLVVFKELIVICNEILDFWNKESNDLKELELQIPLNVTRDNEDGFFHSMYDIYAINFTNENKHNNYNSIESKIDFIKYNDYTINNIYSIASKCNAIISWITGAYPETNDFFLSKTGISNFGKSSIIKNLLKQINNSNFSLADAINYINKETSDETYNLIINEFKSSYETLRNEFMFKINDDDILDAIDTFKNNLEFIYVDDNDLEKNYYLTKYIGNYRTIYNVNGFSSIEKEKTIKLLYLNNLMIDYYNGFFANEIKGFENISVLRDLYNFYTKKENINREKIVYEVETVLKNKDYESKVLHNHIFKDNSFEVWQSMFNDFKIKESSRTDIKFMFEIMKYEKLIHPTVTQTALLNWINDNYQLTISKARYIDFKNDTKRLAIFNKAKSILLKV